MSNWSCRAIFCLVFWKHSYFKYEREYFNISLHWKLNKPALESSDRNAFTVTLALIRLSMIRIVRVSSAYRDPLIYTRMIFASASIIIPRWCHFRISALLFILIIDLKEWIILFWLGFFLWIKIFNNNTCHTKCETFVNLQHLNANMYCIVSNFNFNFK